MVVRVRRESGIHELVRGSAVGITTDIFTIFYV